MAGNRIDRKTIWGGAVARPTAAHLEELNVESRKKYIEALEKNLENAPESWKDKLRKALERARK